MEILQIIICTIFIIIFFATGLVLLLAYLPKIKDLRAKKTDRTIEKELVKKYKKSQLSKKDELLLFLNRLHENGILDDKEFEEKKLKIQNLNDIK